MTIYDKEIKEIGKYARIVIFECDRDISINEIQRLTKKVDSSTKISVIDLLNFQPSSMYQAGIGSCGIGLQLTSYPNVDHLAIDLLYERTPKHPSSWEAARKPHERNETLTIQLSTVSKQNKTLETCKAALTVPILTFKRNYEASMNLYKNGNPSAQLYFNFTLRPTDFYSVFEAKTDGNLYELKIQGVQSDDQKDSKHILGKQCKRDLYDQNSYLPISRDCYVTETDLHKYLITSKASDERNVNSYEVTFPILRPNEFNFESNLGTEVPQEILDLVKKYYLNLFLPPINLWFGVVKIEEVQHFIDMRFSKFCVIGFNFVMDINSTKRVEASTDEWKLYYKNEEEKFYGDQTYEVYGKKAMKKAPGAMVSNESYEVDL